jgi:hypothetical protein
LLARIVSLLALRVKAVVNVAWGTSAVSTDSSRSRVGAPVKAIAKIITTTSSATVRTARCIYANLSIY